MISIILPVYNAKAYIEETIQSILRQTYKEFELIIIDDGSKDNSFSICQKYAMKDTRISVIKKKNGGTCQSRNEGLKYAKGEYIAFCDHDDIYEAELLEKSVEIAYKYNADVVKFGCDEIYLNNRCVRKIERRPDKEEFYENGKIQEAISKHKDWLFYWYIWDGIYKKELFNTILFNETMHYGMEDADFNYRLFSKNPSFACVPKVLYHHYIRGILNTSQKFTKNKLDSLVVAAKQQKKMISCLGMYDRDKIWVLREEGKWFTGILSTLELKDCKLSFSEKKVVLHKYGRQLVPLLENKINWYIYLKSDFKHCLVVWLFRFKFYFLLLILMKYHY